ncbi:MAG: MFS transporter [Alphaproteobacteria bacterium]|nr:MFS transporter [Alphaproteobacteria bacterium]MBM3951467.1 MFS transporter [Rhodospirillales bacterium]
MMSGSDKADPPPPAWRGWLMWAFGAAYFAYNYVHRVGPSVMIPDLMRDFAIGAAMVGNLSALYFYSYIAVQIPGGILLERLGPRAVLAGGATLCGAGCILFGAAPSLAAALVGRFLIGAGVGVAFVSTLKIATLWLPANRFALASGLTVTCGMLGGIVGQAPLAAAVAAFGWRTTSFAVGAVAFIFAVVVALAAGGRPGAAVPPASAGGAASGLAGFGAVLANPRYWLLAFAGFAMSAPLLAFAGLWAVPYFMEGYGLARPAAAATVSIVLVGWAVGAPLHGWLADRLGRWREQLLAANVLALASFAALVYLPEVPLPVVQALLFVNGVACSGLPLVYMAVKAIVPRAVGPALAFVNAFTVAPGAVLQPVVGALLDLAWDGRLVEGARVYSAEAFRFAFLSFVATGTLGVVLAVCARETRAVGRQ